MTDQPKNFELQICLAKKQNEFLLEAQNQSESTNKNLLIHPQFYEAGISPKNVTIMLLSGAQADDDLKRAKQAGVRIVMHKSSSCLVPAPLIQLQNDNIIDLEMDMDQLAGLIV